MVPSRNTAMDDTSARGSTTLPYAAAELASKSLEMYLLVHDQHTNTGKAKATSQPRATVLIAAVGR
jgi:hypothetical protein